MNYKEWGIPAPHPKEWDDARFYVGDLVRDRQTGVLGIVTEVNRTSYAILPRNRAGKFAWFNPYELELIESGPWETMMGTKQLCSGDVSPRDFISLTAAIGKWRDIAQELSPYAAHLDDCELTPCTCGLFDVLAKLSSLSQPQSAR